ncbi:MAG: hypothetical protein M1822_004195 [Bathelium mastoideum]|nr:MAG: hypothetical protein M1822_004195 [Bathelium mastoideum]
MRPSKRQCSTGAGSPVERFTAPDKPASQEDLQKWQGWCKLQSEPSIFNTMLRQLEVQGVRVADVHSLDDLSEPSSSTYGLLFLFPYRNLNGEEDEDDTETAAAASQLWFANQTTENACATIGLINMVCNIPGIDRGEYITQMMSHTDSFSPPLRGFVLSAWAYLRRLHNAYATKADMLLADSAMRHDFDRHQTRSKARAKAQAQAEAKAKAGKSAAKKRKAAEADLNDDDDDDSTGGPSGEHHFMGYVPFAGRVWRLDGLDPTPHCLGPYEGGDWVSIARANIQRYMNTAGPGDQFSLARLVPDPVLAGQRALAANVRGVRSVEERLAALNPEWRQFVSSDEEEEGGEKGAKTQGVCSDAISELGVTEELLGEEEGEVARGEEIEAACLDGLVVLRESLGQAQEALRAGIQEGRADWEKDGRKAEERRFDFGPFIRGLLRKVAEKGVLKEIVEDL